MKFISLVTVVALLINCVLALSGKFDTSLRNDIIKNSRIPHLKSKLDRFYSHLAYLTANKKKVAVTSADQMGPFLRFVEEQKEPLEDTKENLEMELKAYGQVFEELTEKKRSLFNILKSRFDKEHQETLDEQIKHVQNSKSKAEEKLKEVDSKIKIIDDFLRYCSNGTCHTIVQDGDALVSYDEKPTQLSTVFEEQYDYEGLE